MTLAIGTKLGRYEIRSKLGEGGMGEVYRARELDSTKIVIGQRTDLSIRLINVKAST